MIDVPSLVSVSDEPSKLKRRAKKMMMTTMMIMMETKAKEKKKKRKKKNWGQTKEKTTFSHLYILF